MCTTRTGYKEFNSEAICFVPVLHGDISVQLACPEVIKTILGDMSGWPKPDIALGLEWVSLNSFRKWTLTFPPVQYDGS